MLERTLAFNRRSATAGADSAANRGLKPTATFISSLRDESLLRFMESRRGVCGAHWDHEPSDWSAGLRHGAFPLFIAPCRRPALRFMERGSRLRPNEAASAVQAR